MKKTAEELKSKIIQQLRFHRISVLDEDKTAFFIMNLFEEYRSQASELPSDGEAKRIANNFFQWTENLKKGDSMYSELLYCNEHNLRLQDQINSYVASRDARIKELEEDLYRINLLNKQYSNFRNEVLEIPDELIKQIDNKHFPF